VCLDYLAIKNKSLGKFSIFTNWKSFTENEGHKQNIREKLQKHSYENFSYSDQKAASTFSFAESQSQQQQQLKLSEANALPLSKKYEVSYSKLNWRENKKKETKTKNIDLF